MINQYGPARENPVPLGSRVAARLILVAFTIPIWVIFFIFFGISQAQIAAGDIFSAINTLEKANLPIILMGIALGVWNIVLMVRASTTIGAKFKRFRWVIADSGQEAQGRLFLKYLVQSFLESATFGIGLISFAVTYRDGQHWLDRAFGLVAVENTTIGAPQTELSAPAQGPRVMPVQMPHRPLAPGSPSPGSDSVDSPAIGTVRPDESPLSPAESGLPHFGPLSSSSGQSDPKLTAANEAHGVPVTGNPWAMPMTGAEPSGVQSPPTGTVEPPNFFAPAGQAPLQNVTPAAAHSSDGSSPFSAVKVSPEDLGPGSIAEHLADQNPFAPAGQSPIPVRDEQVPAATPYAAALLDDKTVIDHSIGETGPVPVVELDDGQRIELGDPVVLGRNPSAVDAYPNASPILLVDESMRMSKTHMVLLPLDGGVGVYDLGATNGVTIDADGVVSRLAAKEVHTLPLGATLHFGGRSLKVVE